MYSNRYVREREKNMNDKKQSFLHREVWKKSVKLYTHKTKYVPTNLTLLTIPASGLGTFNSVFTIQIISSTFS